MVYSWLLKTNLSDASESPNPCTQALQGQKVSRQARRIPGFCVGMCLNIALNGMNTEQQCDNVNVGVNLMLTSFFCVFLVEFACCLACF